MTLAGIQSAMIVIVVEITITATPAKHITATVMIRTIIGTVITVEGARVIKEFLRAVIVVKPLKITVIVVKRKERRMNQVSTIMTISRPRYSTVRGGSMELKLKRTD